MNFFLDILRSIMFIQLVGLLDTGHLDTWCPKVRGEAGATVSTFSLLRHQPHLELVGSVESGASLPACWIRIHI